MTSVSVAEVNRAVARAAFLVLPSLWYEGLPTVLLQAFACGRPVLAARLGGMAEVVREGETGLLFDPGDPADLARKAGILLSDPAGTRRMGRRARRHYERHFTAEASYRKLLEIYRQATSRQRTP